MLLNTEPWVAEGVCRTIDPDIWFPEKGRSSALAKRLCRQCPVVKECLEYALRTERKHGRMYGVWGATSEHQRRQIHAQTRAAA